MCNSSWQRLERQLENKGGFIAFVAHFPTGRKQMFLMSSDMGTWDPAITTA